MKTVLLVAVPLLFMVGCPANDTLIGLTFDSPDWAETEISHYVITSGEDTLGHRTIKVLKDEFDGIPALNLTIRTSTHTDDASALDSARVMLRTDNLRPIHSARKTVYPGLDREVDVGYSKDSVRATVVTPDSSRSVVIPLEPFDYDHEQLTMLIRALPLSYGEQVSFNIINGIAGKRIPVTVNLVGAETITVPAGVFDCRHIRMIVEDQESDIWYESSGLRRLVRYAAPAAGLNMELVAGTID